MGKDEIREVAFKYAIHNAAIHDGKAQKGPIIARIMGESPEHRKQPKIVIAIVEEVLKEVNSWNQEYQRRILLERWPELLEVRKRDEEKKTLPPLENVDRFDEIRTRFAPNPDGALHLGSAEPIIFCDEYAKMYGGKFILRFEDTSPDVKAPILEIYDWIREDLDWLHVKVDEVYIQSDRLEIYYNFAVKLIEIGAAYVCTCKPSSFKELYIAKKPCPCRDQAPDVHLERWRKMLDGTYVKGDSVVRIKTDLDHPNPAIRDWPALRIATGSHPRHGNKYRVWPLYNFSCGIDDHEMNISHIIRGKEHEVNTTRQRYLAKHLGWEYPEIINIGRLGLEVGILSKSKIRAGIEEGTYMGWDDPRLGTLKALRRRGLQPETIRELMIQVGPKPINATLSWGHIASVNRRLIEPKSRRYFFVEDPVEVIISNVEGRHEAKLLYHPDNPEWGTRNHYIDPKESKVKIIIATRDADNLTSGEVARLMGLFNIKIDRKNNNKIEAKYHSKSHLEARDANVPFLHWLLDNVGIPAKVTMSDASVVEGLAEPGCDKLNAGGIIQFERFGFVRVETPSPFMAFFAHR